MLRCRSEVRSRKIDLGVIRVQVDETGQGMQVASIFWSRTQQTFSVKGQVVSILGVVDHMVSITIAQLCYCMCERSHR